jgi:hypothetical protein
MPEPLAIVEQLMKSDSDVGKYGPRSEYMVDEDE